jgi:hypothetical protein
MIFLYRLKASLCVFLALESVSMVEIYEETMKLEHEASECLGMDWYLK